MKVTTISGAQLEGPTAAQVASQSAARSRAIAMLENSTSQAAPQSKSVEDSPKLSSEVSESSVQNHSSKTEESSASPSVEVSSSPAESSESVKAAVSEEKPLSSEYAILARKERAIRQREQQLRAREAAIKAQEAASKPAPVTNPTFDESKYVSRQRLAESPFETLAELGLSYDQLTELAMNAPKPEQIALQNELKSLKDEIKALKGENENTKKSFQDQQTQAYNQAITQIRNETRSLVRDNPDFETIRGTNSVNDVVDLIKQTFEEDGVLLTVEEAATEVENYLVEEAMKLTRLNKIQRRLRPESAPALKKMTEEPKQQQLKTLTNAVSSTRQLTAKERAILAFKGQLNK